MIEKKENKVNKEKGKDWEDEIDRPENRNK